MNKSKFGYEAILSISAIIIAFASICISIWEGIETRNHNRLTVRPKLEIFFNGGQNSFGYNVVNSGLGPAIVTGMKILVDNEEIKRSGFSGYDELMSKLNLSQRSLRHSAIDSGVVLIAGSDKLIIGCKFDSTDNKEKILTEIYTRISISLEYTSMYEESFICKFP